MENWKDVRAKRLNSSPSAVFVRDVAGSIDSATNAGFVAQVDLPESQVIFLTMVRKIVFVAGADQEQSSLQGATSAVRFARTGTLANVTLAVNPLRMGLQP